MSRASLERALPAGDRILLDASACIAYFLVIASGIVSQIGHLVTNDRQWRSKLRPIAQRIGVCYLADHLPLS